MILVIDNYDSFTYNLVQYLGALGAEMHVVRNDKATVEELAALQPDHVVVSPGPCTPKEAGVSNEVIDYFKDKAPVLGVCLGHQCVGAVFGGDIVRAPRLMHGKTSMIEHDGKSIFGGLPNPFEAVRYHSLVIDPRSVPDCLEVTAWTDMGEIMGVRHRRHPVEGVQFHPESIMTKPGMDLLRNFLAL